MRKNTVLFSLSALVTLFFFWILSTPVGPAPPLGSLLNPNSGFWANAVTAEYSNRAISLDDDKLSDSVSVYFDEYHIPHIFAENDYDLYFAQGFITARDRLWQMEFQTHAAAGRLSEFLGSRMLEYDRYQRRIGMMYAAERSLEGLKENKEAWEAVKAYADGVNAWIDNLNPAEYPLEYKILDYSPEKWTPLKTALLFKYMSYTLSANNGDLRMSNTRAYFGDDFIRNILDIDPDWNDPIIPARKEWDFEPNVPEKPDSDFSPSLVDSVMPFQPNPSNGSNNWAVSGSKTASGYPILVNDPHLNMTLPSIWYTAQLHTPTQNVMGVTLPGSPAVIIGFNEEIAWGTTNVSADVWDWYEIEFRDSTYSEYRYDGRWKNTEKRIEKIKVRGKKTVVDTVVYTHHGPVVQTSSGEPMRSNIPRYHAMHWIAHKKSNEVNYFLDINKAGNYEDYRNALRYYHSPAQNWIFADTSDIALTVTGKYPRKWDEQGRFIGDGSDPEYDWQGWIPFDQIPYIKNPKRGFVSSANQDPTDDTYPYYLDDEFAPYERGRRINDRLAKMEGITAKDMQNLQLDTYSLHAEKVLPPMLKMLNSDTLSGWTGQVVSKLEEWNLQNDGELIAPSVFKHWWSALYRSIWEDEYSSTELPLSWPARDQTAYLLVNKTDLKWYDNINTDQTESIEDLVNSSFHEALQNLQKRFGEYGEQWKWGYVNSTSIRHVGRIPGLGEEVFTDGSGESVNAIKNSHGPSWRMVVELGPEIKAYGIYPGGQSGNPGSPSYAQMIENWNSGELFPLWFMRGQPVTDDSLNYSITLK